MEFAAGQPFSFEAEQSVLGAVIVDSSVLDAVIPILKSSEYFYTQSHRRIYDVMLAMHAAAKPIDFVTLLEEVKAAGIFEEAEGKRYLLQLTEVMPSVENAVNYAKIVADKSVLRSLISAADAIRLKSEQGADEASSILEYAEQQIYEIANGRQNTSLYPLRQGFIEAVDRYGELAEKGDDSLFAVPTGYYDIDSMLNGGMRKSELIILAARPAVGKSSFALNICENAAIKHGITTAFFSLEMSRDQLVDRIMASQALVDSGKLMTGALDEKDWASVGEVVRHLADAPLYFDDTSAITISEIKAKLRRVKNLGLVVIDYLQLMSSARHTENRVQEVSEITRSLKLMAKELNVPVLCLSQLSRKAADPAGARKPVLSDLRESGSIEQDADVVMFLHNENQTSGDAENKCVIQAIIGKNRRGRCGQADLLWVGQYTKFLNLDKKHDVE